MVSGARARPHTSEAGFWGGPWIKSTGDGLGAARALLVGLALLMIGNGLQSAVVGVRSEIEGFGLGIGGLVMAAYYLGFLIGTRAAEHFLATVGHIRLFAALASMASTAAIVYLIWIHPISWIGLRFVVGLCMAGLFVTAESWLNDMASNAIRGRLLATYMVVMMGGSMSGQLMLNVSDPGGFKLFVISSALSSLALVPVSLSASSSPQLAVPKPMGLREVIRAAPVGVYSAFWVGIANGGLVGLGALYAAAEGLPASRISLFVAAPMAGSILMQWPVGAVSDRIQRRVMILVVAIIATAVSAAHLTTAPGTAMSLVLMFALGGSVFPLYSLAVALTGDNVPTSQINGASATLVRTVGVGAVIGPTLGGLLMETISSKMFFVLQIWVNAMIVLYVVYRIVAHRAIPVAEQGRFQPWPARASAMAASLLRRRPNNRQQAKPQKRRLTAKH